MLPFFTWFQPMVLTTETEKIENETEKVENEAEAMYCKIESLRVIYKLWL